MPARSAGKKSKKKEGKITMRTCWHKRLASLLLSGAMLLQLPVTALAATPAEKKAPPEKYYIQNDAWHYAEELPSKGQPVYNAVDATLNLDAADEEKVVLPTAEAKDTATNGGILSQFGASGTTASGKALSYRSAALNGASDLVGYPTADLHLTAGAAGTVTVSLEAVDAKGAVTEVARGTVKVTAGENTLKGIALVRAYDDGQKKEHDFVAYQFPRSGSIRVSLSADQSVTLHQDGASKVTLPFTDHYETGYNGKATVDGKEYSATLYWLNKKIYLNYNDAWLAIPADTAYTVNSDGAADFGAFTFRQMGNTAFKDGTVQDYDGSGVYTQPIPTYRHVHVDTVEIEPVADLLYVPTEKALYQDIFMPTDGVEAKDEGNLPAVIYIHGFGGSYSQLKQDFAYEILKEGYAVIGVDLRNYPSNFAPDYYHDVKGNIRHLRANAEKYGIDPDRIGIYGVSLGGNTSLMMAVSAGNEYMEGTVGGNLDVSSRLQAAVCGYAWSDAIHFGADQRTDNANDPELLGKMISGGDGENAPCAQAIGFYGPGKGYLVLRNYKEAREAAEKAGTLDDFLSKPYTVTIDDDYIEKWYPVLGANAFTGSSATATKGTYTFEHEYMMEKLTYAEAASPLYYISPDDPSIMVFGGYGATQNITNTQSTRTLKRLNEMGVPGVMAGNTQGNYGGEAEVKASMLAYLDRTLKNRPAGVRAALTVGAEDAVVNDMDVAWKDAVVEKDGELQIDVKLVNEYFGTDLEGERISVEDLQDKIGKQVTITTYTGTTYVGNTKTAPYTTVTLVKSAPAATGSAPSEKVELKKVSLPNEYKGFYEDDGGDAPVYKDTVVQSAYVGVPAHYNTKETPDLIKKGYLNVEAPSETKPEDDPSYDAKKGTIDLAVSYTLPSDDGVKPHAGKYPVVVEITRDRLYPYQPEGTTTAGSQYNVEYLVEHGYAWVMINVRGCGSSFGVNNSFASLENRNDVRYIMDNWIAKQDWYDAEAGIVTMGGSNRGLIQWATATTQPEELVAISPIVNNPDFYYQDYRNGVSCVPGSGAKLSGSHVDAKILSYDEWMEADHTSTNMFVDGDKDGRKAYEAYAYYTARNKAFTSYLLYPNLTRDQVHPLEEMAGERVNLTIPAIEYYDEIVNSGVEVHQNAGYYDANITFQIAAANTWGGQIVIGPWGHGAAIRGTRSEKFNDSALDVANQHLRWFDYVLKGWDNGYEDAPKYYYYVVNAPKGEEWRYSDTFPLENSVDSVLYLAGKDSGEVIPDALQLDGAQSNNGKLSLVKPKGSSVDYRVDTSIKPINFSNLDLSNTGEMKDEVDAKGLTFTSAPLSSAAEIVGIPTVNLWVSCENSNDADFIAYLEEVAADGSSKMITQGCVRASHRTTGKNEMWDSTKGLAGRYHTSLTKDVEAALKEGMDEPVLLQFNLEAIAYKVAAGSSIRLTVTCANTSVYQHQAYYAVDKDGNYIVEDGKYVLKTGDELPLITLYQGGDRASSISIPVVENVSNTFNGTVTFKDGSSYPGTMYLFDENWYLYANGDWTRLSVKDKENTYTVKDNAAVFKAGFTFLPEGSRVIKNGIAQNYQGGQANVQPFPTNYKLHVDTVTHQVGNTNANMLLYLPVSKSLDINLFMPENADGPVPVILYIHGFGGTNIDLDANLLPLLDQGYALAGVDLRNYPPNENPLYYQDIKGDIRYLRAHAKELGLDPERFGIYGVSLGGNTSLMMLLSGGDEFLEGNVGGNLNVSSRVQAGICGYAWSDAIYFGADQRSDNDNDFELMKSMISGGDGENAPCAQAIDFSGPGKGYLVLRNYLEARQAAERDGKLDEFLAEKYTVTIDKAYVDRWFPGQEGSANAFIGSGATVTLGTYTYDHDYLMEKVEAAEKASPMYYASPDDPVVVVFGGFGGRQNITNQQSVRTESALQDSGVLAFYYGNSVVSWNDYSKYGNPAAIQAGFQEYWDHYLKEGPSGTKIVLTVGSDHAVVNYVDREISKTLKLEDGKPMIPSEVINQHLGTKLKGYLTVDEVKESTGASVTWNADYKMVVIQSGKAR